MGKLNERQRTIVKYVEENGPCLVADIAKHLKEETAIVRAALKRLIEKRYLTKRRIMGLAAPTLGGIGKYHCQRMIEIRIGDRKLDECEE
jgi:DeoR/GlpR family transcriptional regulator of sugar metabolism